MSEPTPLSLSDMTTISEAVLRLVAGYSQMPTTVQQKNILWQSLGDAESIGLFPLQGAIYISKYVSGNYTAQFPFRIIYKCNPTQNAARIKKQEVLATLSAWLEGCTATFTDTRISLQSIERTSPVFKQEADGSGYEQYTCTMNLKYSFKKG